MKNIDFLELRTDVGWFIADRTEVGNH